MFALPSVLHCFCYTELYQSLILYSTYTADLLYTSYVIFLKIFLSLTLAMEPGLEHKKHNNTDRHTQQRSLSNLDSTNNS